MHRVDDSPRISAMSRYLLVTFVSFVFALVTARPLSGADHVPRLRTTDPHIRAVLEAGLAHSPSLRALVHRLAGGDVVVYLRGAQLSPRLDGQLTFVSAAGGFRYVVVHLAADRPWHRQIAALGHELQHAVEIAEHPDIIDHAALARAYTRIGFPRVPRQHAVRSFDTLAAIAAGEQIRRELARSSAAEE
jgi:hypothetical protein